MDQKSTWSGLLCLQILFAQFRRSVNFSAIVPQSVREEYLKNPSETLLWEEDPAASVGKALKMENTHTEWHIQCRNLPVGTYDVYVDVRCDSRNPEVGALERSQIVAHVQYIVYPLDNMRRIDE